MSISTASSMTKLRTVGDVISANPPKFIPRLEAPRYSGHRSDETSRVGLAVESMKRHMSNEGYEIFQGLMSSGYVLCGRNLPVDETSVPMILKRMNPSIVVVQDEREWDVRHGDFRDASARFYGIEELAKQQDIFKLTILKDAHQRNAYHSDSAARMGCHSWIIYYHPRIVAHLAPFVRPEHIIRTWHSLDSNLVPEWGKVQRRDWTMLSGAVSSAYPLRRRLFQHARDLPSCSALRHPGYHMRGSNTPAFLGTLPAYKVSICTSSVYGYALRKIVESTACGCIVITDLPTDEVMPEIENWIDSELFKLPTGGRASKCGNIVRISPDISIPDLAQLIRELYANWNDEQQRHWAEKAKAFYDFRAVGKRLADDIEVMRRKFCA